MYTGYIRSDIICYTYLINRKYSHCKLQYENININMYNIKYKLSHPMSSADGAITPGRCPPRGPGTAWPSPPRPPPACPSSPPPPRCHRSPGSRSCGETASRHAATWQIFLVRLNQIFPPIPPDLESMMQAAARPTTMFQPTGKSMDQRKPTRS